MIRNVLPLLSALYFSGAWVTALVTANLRTPVRYLPFQKRPKLP